MNYNWELPVSEFNQLVTRSLDTEKSDFISDLDEDVFEAGINIYDAVHIPFKIMIKSAGYTQAGFAEKFLIPKRTVEDWCSGKRKPAIYLKILFAEKLGVLKVKRI